MLYTVTKIDIFNEPKGVLIFAFMFDSWYSNTTFQGIIPDNRAAGVFIASLPQVIILSKLDLIILVNSSIAKYYLELLDGIGIMITIPSIWVSLSSTLD
jgi:hypothetical protein